MTSKERLMRLDAQIQHFEEKEVNTPAWSDEADVIDDAPDHRIIHHMIHTPEALFPIELEAERDLPPSYLPKFSRNFVCPMIKKYMRHSTAWDSR